MDEKALLEAIGQMMDSKLENAMKPIKEDIAELRQELSMVKQSQVGMAQALSEVKTLAIKTAVIVENDVSTNIALLQEDNIEIVRKLKRLEKLPQAVDELQADVSVIKNVVASHSQELNQLKAQ